MNRKVHGIQCENCPHSLHSQQMEMAQEPLGDRSVASELAAEVKLGIPGNVTLKMVVMMHD